MYVTPIMGGLGPERKTKNIEIDSGQEKTEVKPKYEPLSPVSRAPSRLEPEKVYIETSAGRIHRLDLNSTNTWH